MFLEATLPNLENAAENNVVALLETLGALPDAEVLITPEMTRCRVSGITNPMFNGIGSVHVTPESADALIKDTLAYFRETGASSFFWWIGNQTQPSDLALRLEQHGLERSEAGSPAMAVDLAAMDETTTTPPNFHITQVETEADLLTWADTFVASFGISPDSGKSWIDATLRVGIQHAAWTLYTGWLDQTPVAVSMLFPGAGVAGLYAVGTLVSARGQGIGKAITLRPLTDARAQGCKIGTLFSSRLGFPVYRKIGFVQYGAITRYYWERE